MTNVARNGPARKQRHDPNNKRIYELSQLARYHFPDGDGDYVLPDTLIGQHLAIAIITHLARNGCRDSRWLFKFCAARAPWLDPNEVDIAKLHPLKAQALGNQLELTAECRDRLHITSIAPCDQTPEQRTAIRKARKRERDAEYRRQKRAAAGSVSRASYEAASLSRTKPWEVEGVSRRTWERRRAAATPSKPHRRPVAVLVQARRRANHAAVASPSSSSKNNRGATHLRHGGRATCLTVPTGSLWDLVLLSQRRFQPQVTLH